MAVYRTSSRYGARRPARRTAKAKPKYQKRSMSSAITVPRNSLSGGGFPEKLTTTLRYVERITLVIGGTTASKIFRMNSPFDPNYTDSGHQPMYFDQLAAVYGRYQVTGATLKCEFSPITSDTELVSNGPWLVGIGANNNGTFSSNVETKCEQNRTQYGHLTRDQATALTTLQMTYLPKRDLGLNAMDDAQGAVVSTNPITTYWAEVWASNLGDSGTTNISCLITLDQKICFIRQKDISGS